MLLCLPLTTPGSLCLYWAGVAKGLRARRQCVEHLGDDATSCPRSPRIVPAKSKKDSPLAKAELILKDYSASGIMSLGIHARNGPAEAREGEKEERRCSRQCSRSSSADTWEDHDFQALTVQPILCHWQADVALQLLDISGGME